jgi:hypothetical protein
VSSVHRDRWNEQQHRSVYVVPVREGGGVSSGDIVCAGCTKGPGGNIHEEEKPTHHKSAELTFGNWPIKTTIY